MDLILWRHADAEDGRPDLQRELTGKGRKQAARVAAWLAAHLPKGFEVISSPAARARQTAEALTRQLKVENSLAPGASVQAIVKAAGWPHGDGAVVLVGHQPDLGQALAYLVSGREGGWRLEKAACWWLAEQPVIVKAVVSPDLLP
ncbi:MAG: SixA phosphatase family protein [Betaproteobacteria bacterium]